MVRQPAVGTPFPVVLWRAVEAVGLVHVGSCVSSLARRTRKSLRLQRKCHQLPSSDHDLRGRCGFWSLRHQNARSNATDNREPSSSQHLQPCGLQPGKGTTLPSFWARYAMAERDLPSQTVIKKGAPTIDYFAHAHRQAHFKGVGWHYMPVREARRAAPITSGCKRLENRRNRRPTGEVGLTYRHWG